MLAFNVVEHFIVAVIIPKNFFWYALRLGT